MSLAKKGSRRIVVEQVAYRWSVRPRPTYHQGLGGALVFAVEREVGGQSILVVTLDAPRPDNCFHAPGCVVTPAMVAHAIRQGLAQGWMPACTGSPFALTLSAAMLGDDASINA